MSKVNIGFETDHVIGKKTLCIGIIDADLLDNGTRHPNLALLKISGFSKSLGHNVRLICNYDEILSPKGRHYDLLIMSKVFKFTKVPAEVEQMINSGKIIIGGTGFFEINGPNLPDEVEHFRPDYSLYLEYISRDSRDEAKKKKYYNDYLNYSIGFTTRGCIRHCGFCVNRLSNRVVEWSPVDEFYDESRPCIYLWDDNIMAAPPKVFQKVLDSLMSKGRPFQFRQGMDIRLMTDHKADLLSKVKYHGDYIFAFDHYRMDDPNERIQVEQTIDGLRIWRRNCLKSTKLYVLAGYDGQDEKDIEGIFYRIKILMEFGCLPYIMRFEKYSESKYKSMYIQIARWCNQPNFFKKKSFRQYCEANEAYHKLNSGHKKEHCSCYQTMIDFEREFPDIARKYFDLRFDELNKYEIK